MTRRLGAFALVMVSVALGGCLFRSTDGPRFYRPASVALDAADDDDAPPAATGVPVRIQTVRSAPFLRERMAWRSSAVEYGLYEQRRWSELPTRYVRRALSTAIQDTPGIRVGDAGARLDVEILAFDEVLTDHHARVVLAASLRQGTETRLARTFAADAPVSGDDGGAVAQAMGRALDEIVKEIASATARALAAPSGRGSRRSK